MELTNIFMNKIEAKVLMFSSCIPTGYLIKCLFVYLKGSIKDKETYIFHLLMYFPNGSNGWDWVRPNPGAGDLIQVSFWVTRAQAFEQCAADFPDTLTGFWIRRVEQPELIWDQHGRQYPNVLHHNANPTTHYFSYVPKCLAAKGYPWPELRS